MDGKGKKNRSLTVAALKQHEDRSLVCWNYGVSRPPVASPSRLGYRARWGNGPAGGGGDGERGEAIQAVVVFSLRSPRVRGFTAHTACISPCGARDFTVATPCLTRGQHRFSRSFCVSL